MADQELVAESDELIFVTIAIFADQNYTLSPNRKNTLF
jgi:hypothetical protein